MIIEFDEHEGCFAITMTAENMAEAAQLVRFGMNRTDKINSASSDVHQDGSFSSSLVFAKNKRANCAIPKRK